MLPVADHVPTAATLGIAAPNVPGFGAGAGLSAVVGPVGVGLDGTVGDGFGVAVGVVSDGSGDAVAAGLGLDAARAAAAEPPSQTSEPLNASRNATANAHWRSVSSSPPSQPGVRNARLSHQLARRV
jgi:hypothetical protein